MQQNLSSSEDPHLSFRGVATDARVNEGVETAAVHAQGRATRGKLHSRRVTEGSAEAAGDGPLRLPQPGSRMQSRLFSRNGLPLRAGDERG